MDSKKGWSNGAIWDEILAAYPGECPYELSITIKSGGDDSNSAKQQWTMRLELEDQLRQERKTCVQGLWPH